MFSSHPPAPTRERIRVAYLVAVAADLLQLLLGPVGWVGADELVDVAVMIVMWRVLGFHPLFLPTFALEFLPVTDILPSWTACVALVVALRKRQYAGRPSSADPGPFIDA